MATKVVELFRVTGHAATVTGAAKSLAIGPARPITEKVDAANNKIAVALVVGTITGSGTLTADLEGRFGNEWVTLSLGSAFAAVTNAASKQVRTLAGPVPIEIRGIATRAGTITFDAFMEVVGVD